MKRFLLRLSLPSAAALFLASACDDSRPIAPLRDGLAECAELGELCHDPGVRLGGEYEACHDLAHVNDGKACLDAYERCKTLCETAPEGGAGGAGGEGHGHAGGGGDDHGQGGTGGA